MAECRRRDKRAEADSLGDRGESGERGPRVECRSLRADDRCVVIGAEEAFEPVALGEPSEAHPILPGDAFLPLDHQANAHTQATAAMAVGSVTGRLQTKRSQT